MYEVMILPGFLETDGFHPYYMEKIQWEMPRRMPSRRLDEGTKREAHQSY